MNGDEDLALAKLLASYKRHARAGGLSSVLLQLVGGEQGRRRPRPGAEGGYGRGLPGERQVGEQRDHAARAEGARGAEADALGAREHGG